MATKSEQFRAEEQRRARASKKSDAPAARETPDVQSNESERAGKKATYALEPKTTARPSRKSSRKSANRAKPDAGMNIRQELVQNTPEARYHRENPR